MSIEEKKISKRLQECLLVIYKENWANINHNENLRIHCLTAYTAILSGILYVISQSEWVRKYLFYPIFFLLIFSIINLLVAVKVEGVVEDYVKRNQKIVEKLSMQEYAGLRVMKGVWKVVRHRYLFPFFYLIMTFAMAYFLIYILGII